MKEKSEPRVIVVEEGALFHFGGAISFACYLIKGKLKRRGGGEGGMHTFVYLSDHCERRRWSHSGCDRILSESAGYGFESA